MAHILVKDRKSAWYNSYIELYLSVISLYAYEGIVVEDGKERLLFIKWCNGKYNSNYIQLLKLRLIALQILKHTF